MTSCPASTRALRLGTAKSGDPMKMMRISPSLRGVERRSNPVGAAGLVDLPVVYRLASLAMTEDRYGVTGDRNTKPGARPASRARAAVGPARGAAPDEEARNRAPAIARGAAE